jgi:hypothetical protein
MRARRLSGLVLIATLVGCSTGPSFPSPPGGMKRIAVEKPANRTGDELIVYGPGLLQRLLKLDTATVPDVLAEDLRTTLSRQGFRLADPDQDVPVLKTEILRWEPYAANYETVTVDLVATLVEPGGRELWRAAPTGWVVSTNDAYSRHEASIVAAETVAEALLQGWKPAEPCCTRRPL